MKNNFNKENIGIRRLLNRGVVRSLIKAIRKTPLKLILMWGRRIYRNYYLKRTMKKILSNPRYFLNDRETLSELSYDWGNEGWSASIDCLQDCVKYVEQSKLPILECGSGLSTIVIGLAAKEFGKSVWSLEHTQSWYKWVKKTLIKYKIDSVKLIYAPPVEHGDLLWYDAPLNSMPSEFSLVLCDGPAGTERRSKQNIFPIMKDKFVSGCIIIYDDIPKIVDEDDIPGWVNKLNMSSEIRGTVNPYYVFKIP